MGATVRFGDGTPFPLGAGFLDTLTAVIDAAVELHRSGLAYDGSHRRAREARRLATDELRRLDALDQLLGQTLAPLCPPTRSGERPSEQAAARILELGDQAVRQARAHVIERRDHEVSAAIEARPRQAVHAALERLLASHELPGTAWGVRVGRGADGARSLALAGEIGDELRFELDGEAAADALPERLGELCGGADLVAEPRAGGKPWLHHLGGLALDELEVTTELVRLRLATGRPAGTLSVVVPRDRTIEPILVALDPDGHVRAELAAEADTQATLATLAAALRARAATLVSHRRRLVGLHLRGVPVGELEHPSTLADALLALVGPLTREVRLRSRVPGELVLKRDLDGDRREERFVARRGLEARYAELPDHQRRGFEALGLGTETTHELRLRWHAA